MNKTIEQVVDFMKAEIESLSLGARSASEVRETDEIIGDLGLDSLDYATVMLRCETWLGVTVDESRADWRNLRTVGQLAAFLHAQQ